MSSKPIDLQFKAARRAGTPIIAIKTLDAEALIQSLKKSLNGNSPILQHDIVLGLRSHNDEGKAAITTALRGEPVETTIDEVEAMKAAKYLPEGSVLFMVNAHRWLDKATAAQALANLVTPFKEDGSTIVILGPDFDLPQELQQYIFVMDEPLPDQGDLALIVSKVVEEFNESTKSKVKVTEKQLDKAVDALRGLAAFAAEQSTAMSLSKAGLDLDGLWERKRQLISNTPGLSIWRGGQTFDDLGGLDAIKARFRRILTGRRPPRVIVWIDEGEKSSIGANAMNDLSGTSGDQMGVMLSEMQDKEYSGVVLMGVSGAAKSAFAKAIANEGGILTIRLDLGGAKGDGLVGQAEHAIRHAMKVIEAVGGVGGAFFVMTSNDIRAIKPELKRRFRKGIYFFDLPTKAERDVIWNIYLSKYPDADFSGEVIDFDEDWTGAEIETCVATAWEERISLREAARGIVPVAVSGKEEMDMLRRESVGRYNSASYEGPYQEPVKEVKKPARRFKSEEAK